MAAPTPPVTQRDVAQVCGVHSSTICLALKNSPSIPLETRRRIQAVADELGYQPNAAARNLALLRTDKKPSGSLPIAWVNQESRRDHWRTDPHAKICFSGARRQAEACGYHLEEVWTQEPGMSVARIVQILRARGIVGAIFPIHRVFDFALLSPAWSEFSMVGINDHRLGEWLDVVCPDYYQNADTALKHLRQLEFRRVGLVLNARVDAATQGLVHSCYLRHQSELPLSERVPVCFVSENADLKRAEYLEWLRDYRPDSVLCADGELTGSLPDHAFSETFLVQLYATGGDGAASVDPRAAEIGSAAVECTIEKMRRFEKGMRDSTRLHLVRGVWHQRPSVNFVQETVVA